jgi:alkanesulfonate monooxygenase SsuD/methylene tetrahydromethanopterin reductase-like flavin-dependent oxidoreductase (luciferase family)
MLVSPVTLRHPATTAMAASTLDQISRGRLEWGLGAGGSDLAYQQYGIALPPLPERMDRLEEACQAITGLWSGQPVTLEGRYYQLREARLEPGPVQSPLPLVLGGAGEKRFLPIAARYADVWNTILAPAGEYRRKASVLDEHCERAGRDPRRIRRSLTFRAVLAETPGAAKARAKAIADRLGPDHPDHREYLTIGTPAQCAEDLEAFRGLGVTDFLLGCRPPLDWETIELFAREVAPALRQAAGQRGVG